tara:strand:- start:428 stop:556 length:129 start_codon:yes stop_codon:yes gene_type:complete
MVVRKSSIAMSVKLILETSGTVEKKWFMHVLINVLEMPRKTG